MAPAPEVNGHAEEVEEKEEVKSEQAEEKEAESHSNASAETEVLLTCLPPHSTCFKEQWTGGSQNTKRASTIPETEIQAPLKAKVQQFLGNLLI